MKDRNYRLTFTARADLRAIKARSQREFGKMRTEEYFKQLHAGFQYAALHPESIPRREEMTQDTGLSLHHIGSHYAVFKCVAEDEIIIGAILGEHMNIPACLKRLQMLTQREIAVIEELIRLQKP